MRKLLLVWGLFTLAVAAMSGCVDSKDEGVAPDAPDKMGVATFEGTEYQHILPDPSTDYDVTFTGARHFSLSPVADYDPDNHKLGNYVVDTGVDEEGPHWSFGLDEEGMAGKFGQDFVAAARQRLVDYFEDFVASAHMANRFAGAVKKSPFYADMDLSKALDISGLTIQSVSIHDGMMHDADGDGELETAYSTLTVLARLPAFEVPTPASPFPACDELLATDDLAQEYAENSGVTYVPAADATWRYHVHIVAHFYLQDLSEAHGRLWSPTDHVSVGEVAAAAHDMGVIKHFLENVDHSFPESDVAFTIRPDHDFAQSTLHVVAEVAKASVNPDCVREVDGWLAGPGLLHPLLSTAHLAGEVAPTFLEYAYNPDVDESDSSSDPGIVCLHDDAGNSFRVNDEHLACSTPSGAIQVSPWEGSSTRTSHDDFVFETPYVHMGDNGEQVPHFLDSMTCTDGFWGQFCTSRFGRGLRICLTEWGIHNQVGDYWNIHWWQDSSKAAEQVAITAVAYVLKGIAQVLLGESSLMVVVITQGADWAVKVADDLTKTKVAGYCISSVANRLKKYFAVAKEEEETLTTTGAKLLADFLIARVVDGLAQMAQVEATSWQDYSNNSKCACDFEFAHPNKCKGETPSFDGWLGDLTRDGKADLLAINTATNDLRLYPGDGNGALKASYKIGQGWGAYSQLMHFDFDGDGINDVVARNGDDLRWFPRNASNGWKESSVVGSVAGTDVVTSVGDWDHDGDQDIIGRKGDTLYLYPNNGQGGLDPETEIGHGWGNYGLFVGPGDFDGDGDADLIVRNETTKALWLYRGGNGAFQGDPVEIGTNWGAFVKLVAGDFNGDQNPDIVGKTDSAEIHLYEGDGEGGFGQSSIIGSSGWSSYDIY